MENSLFEPRDFKLLNKISASLDKNERASGKVVKTVFTFLDQLLQIPELSG